MKFNTAIFTFLILLSSHLFAQELIPADKLQEDFAILKQSLEELHPALYKYDDKASRDKDFATLKENLNQDLTSLEVYAEISAFTAKIKCGHTYANYWNQNKEIRTHFIEAENKLPFTFRIIDQKMYVHQNLSDESQIQSGDRILSIDGISTEKILSNLLAYVNSDGNNDGKRYFELQVFGQDNYNCFLIFFIPCYLRWEINWKSKFLLTKVSRRKALVFLLSRAKNAFKDSMKDLGSRSRAMMITGNSRSGITKLLSLP